MKAVIVEIKGRDVAALTNEGCVIKIKNEDYSVGQAVEIKAQTSKKTAKIIAWAASAAAAIVLIDVSSWAYLSPYTYVSLDVNPSIEYSVNRFDRVLSVSAVNGDGTEILDHLDLRNQAIDEAVKNTVDKIRKAGYFEGPDPGEIEISTSSKNQQTAENLAKELKTTALQATEGTASPVQVEAISVGRQLVLDAKGLGTTPGKLTLVQKLQASAADPNSIDIKEWLKKPIKSIAEAIKENKKAENNRNSSVDKKKENEDSSSSTAGKTGRASSKITNSSGAVQQKPKSSEKSSASAKSNNGTAGQLKYSGNSSAVNKGAASASSQKEQVPAEPEKSNAASSQVKTLGEANAKNSNQNQGRNQTSGKGNS